MTRTLSTLLLGAVGLAIFAGVGWMIRADAQAVLLELLGWIEGLGPLGPAILILLETVTVVFVLPGIVLTLGGGYLFGFVAGTLYMMTGTTLGATLAFLIGRWFFGERMRRYVLEHPKLGLISDEFTPEGWKIVLLTRLIPLFPYKLSNYFFGLIGFRLWHFVLGTVVGLLPITMVLVYAGSLAHDLTTLGVDTATRSPLVWALYVAGLVAAIIAVAYITRHARRALDRYRPADKDAARLVRDPGAG